ncbi:MAG: hypothetical protein QM752_04845 [Gammaproteobacteria bacterium]
MRQHLGVQLSTWEPLLKGKGVLATLIGGKGGQVLLDQAMIAPVPIVERRNSQSESKTMLSNPPE